MATTPSVKRRLLYIVPLLLLVAVVLLALRMQSHKEQTHAKTARDSGRPIPVDVVPVAEGDVKLSLPTECVAQANPLIRIGNPAPGRLVARTHVRIGARVDAGQPMLELDDRAELVTLKNAQERTKVTELYVRAERERADYFVAVRAEGLGLERDSKLATVDAARAMVDLATAQADQRKAEVDLSRTRVLAPVHGVVMGVAQPGETEYSRLSGEASDKAGSGAVLAIGVINPIIIECDLPEDKLVFLRSGQSIGASFPSLPGERFEARLLQVRPSARQDQRTVSIVFELPNPAERLLPGVHGLVQIQERWGGLRIPSVSLVNPRADTAQVFVIDGQNKAQLRQIMVGGQGDGWVQVLSGLKKGEQVAVVGQIGLQVGDNVRIGRVVDSTAPRR